LLEARVCASQVNPREEHDIEGDDGFSCGSCCITRVFTLVEDMESGVKALDDLVALFLCDAWRLGKIMESLA
jgi:hypothetical protein